MLLENLRIDISETAREAGEKAGRAVEAKLLELQAAQDEIRVIFAAAPSQDYMLGYLTQSKQIDWSKIVAFNMDEYIGLPNGAKQAFSNYLEDTLFKFVTPKAKYFINPSGTVDEELARVTALIAEKPIDVVCLGIGQNGHIAFNDPPVADFDDQQVIKEVELDQVCRMQQVIDGCFVDINQVPTHALTLTIPTIMKASSLYCVVVGEHKAEAVKHTLSSEITTLWPSTILREHANCQFFFDEAACPQV